MYYFFQPTNINLIRAFFSKFPKNLRYEHRGVRYQKRKEEYILKLFKKPDLVDFPDIQKQLDIMIERIFEKIGMTHTCEPQMVYYMLESESGKRQDAHIDFDYNKMTPFMRESDDYYIAFIPVTEEGMHIQLWGRENFDEVNGDPARVKETYGRVVHIPYGKCMLVKGNAIHAGGFREIHDKTFKRIQIHISRDSRRSPLPVDDNNVYGWYHQGYNSFDNYFDQAPPSDRVNYLPLEYKDNFDYDSYKKMV